MSSRYYVREIQDLDNFQGRLSHYGNDLSIVMANTGHTVDDEEKWIQERVRYWAKEVQRRQRSYEDCRRQSSASGNGSDCSGEMRDLRRAEEALETARKWASRIEAAISEYREKSKATKRLASSDIPNTCHAIAEAVSRYQSFTESPTMQTAPKVITEAISRSGSVPLNPVADALLGGLLDYATGKDLGRREIAVQTMSTLIKALIPPPIKLGLLASHVSLHLAADLVTLHGHESMSQHPSWWLEKGDEIHKAVDKFNVDAHIESQVRTQIDRFSRSDHGIALNDVFTEVRVFFGAK